MILYFSATGNTRYVANLIAKELGDETIDMLPLIKKDKACQIRSDRPFIICVPSYICDVPVFIAQFLKKVTLQGNDLVYTVFTCGHSSGIASNTVKEIVECQGKKFAGSYDVSMPNNYIVVDMFKGTPDDEIAFRLKDAEFSAKRIALAVKSKRILKSKKVSLIKKQAIKAVVNGYVKYKQSAKPFHVDNNKCLHCGKCENVCPVNKIHMSRDRYPVWDDSCMHCMSCIGNCPVDAIEFGEITKNKVKYNISKYLGDMGGSKT